MATTMRFTTPTLTATPAALDLLDRADVRPQSLLTRHFAGEWGGDADNAVVNERYLRNGDGMLLSIFDVAAERVWVISHIGNDEDDYTTILLPSEY